jgi:hypothetical protein
MEIQIKNPGMPPFKIERPSKKNGIKWSYKANKIVDRFQARECSITLPREVPAKQFAEVLFTESGKPAFRGYVEQYDIDNKRTKTLTIQGMEKQLEYRYTPDFFYPDGTTLTKLFTHAPTLNDPPGLLLIANGLIPPGREYTVHDAANNTLCLNDAGTESRYGHRDLYYIDYKYIKELPSVHDVGELAYIDKTHYRNATDLWIRIDHDYSRGWADRGGVICDGVNDTTIRLGTCPTDTLQGDLTTQSLEDNIADLITDLVAAHGYHMHFRDAAKYTYLDIDSTEGRS